MPYIPNKGYTVSGVLAAAVAHSGTFTVSYPSGTSQLDFNVGLANPNGHYVILNNGANWTSAASKMSLTFGASDITVTNSSGESWAAGTEYVINIDVYDNSNVAFIHFHQKLAKLANGDIVTEFRPGLVGTIEHWSAIVTDPATTAAKLATLNLEIGTTNLTGGTLALTSANMTPLGAIVEASAITAGNTLARDSKLSIEASSVTAFVEGEIDILIRVRLADVGGA